MGDSAGDERLARVRTGALTPGYLLLMKVALRVLLTLFSAFLLTSVLCEPIENSAVRTASAWHHSRQPKHDRYEPAKPYLLSRSDI